MNVTKREKNLWIGVGIAVLIMLVFNIVFNNLDHFQGVIVDASELGETRRLLRSERNIVARQQAVNKALADIEKSFLDASIPESSKIRLLQEVESLTSGVGLAVEQKNLLLLEQDIIGVALEGDTEPATLIKFLHVVATTRLGLDVKRLQVHANQKTKQLKYQVILQLLLVEKKADK